MTVTQALLLQALELLAEVKPSVARDISVTGQRRSVAISEFLAKNQGAFFELQALASQDERQ